MTSGETPLRFARRHDGEARAAARGGARAARPAAAALALLCAVALLGAGCSSSTMTVYVDSAPETNGGLPFYAVFRTVDQAGYVTDTYEAVSAKVFKSPADPSIVRTEVIYPGIEKEIEIEKPQQANLGIYFLFTKPGERWKTSLRQPLPSSVEIELRGSQIENES